MHPIPKYIKQILKEIKGEIDKNTIIVEDFNMPLTSMDRSRQKINTATVVLNDTIDQLNLIDIYRTLYAKTKEHTFFSSANGTFSRTDHILGHTMSLKRLKRIEIISSIYSTAMV